MDISKAVEQLKLGNIIAYPTETIWGLGVDAFNIDAIEKLREIKGRKATKALSVLVRDIQMAGEYVNINEIHKKFLNIFWPGPVTFILPSKDKKLSENLGGIDTIGLRCSSHPLTLKLVNLFAGPIVTTSANKSGKPDATNIEQLEWLPNEVCIVPWESALSETGSTVVSIVNDKLEVLREGSVSSVELQRVFELLKSQH